MAEVKHYLGIKYTNYRLKNECCIFQECLFNCYAIRQNISMKNWCNQVKCRFCKKLLLYEWNSRQLNTFFITFGWVQHKPTQKWWQTCSNAQNFIRKEVTSYKIHTLASRSSPLYSIVVDSYDYCYCIDRLRQTLAYLFSYKIRM